MAPCPTAFWPSTRMSPVRIPPAAGSGARFAGAPPRPVPVPAFSPGLLSLTPSDGSGDSPPVHAATSSSTTQSHAWAWNCLSGISTSIRWNRSGRICSGYSVTTSR
ncbi:hypothetical protein D0Q02_23385 [Micromonospora craniellae]|uniref:Uncharacterized protein n=1 Tax=Micromonospora craniellae TaxID=2294034 RepID=A0A372FU07_9ACTN|nr:hypothetical protein D0Q02_23385 [Micromonospora craniellae]